ncbi:nuclease-related domain-containing protein [Rossellomorea sp. NPDC077527]|uniref:nuclease-related domain-containing protein n=1 Tax=Rossellomorea sp. NPDC077527 TaxID=3364510 RepID=UPI0037C68B15
MIIKVREIPLIILYYEALLRRLPPQSRIRSKIEESLLKAWAGYHGECKADRQLSTIDHPQMLILNDLCIPIGKTFFQIDTLILTKTFILVLEIKNIAGTMEFGSEFDQFSRTYKGEVTGFPNPISQANRNMLHLSHWFQKKKLPLLPLDYLVVFTNSTSLLTSSNRHRKTVDKAIKVENLVAKYLSIQESYSRSKSVLIQKELKKISNALMKEHLPYSAFKEEHDEIIPGVRCSQCNRFNMVRQMRSWYCTACGIFDKVAHQQAIFDYLLLVNPTITNKRAREFLGVESSRVAYKLLNTMKLASEGTGKGRVYSLPQPNNQIQTK